MVHPIEGNAKLFAMLEKVDEEMTEQARCGGCLHCGGVLHRADYPRKPRGELGEAEKLFEKRFSLCCSREGCRRRLTPQSVRFLGRKVYVGFVVLVVGVMWAELMRTGAVLGKRLAGVPLRTVRRWDAWWRTGFTATSFWRAERARLLPPVDEDALVASLVERFGTTEQAATYRRVLAFLAPVTTNSARIAMGS